MVRGLNRYDDKERRKYRRDYKSSDYKKGREERGERKFRRDPFFKRNKTDWNIDDDEY